MTEVLANSEKVRLQRRIKFIVAFTVAYNVIEAIVALAAGNAADSGALIGFGLDSTIEVTSALAVAWQFTRKDPEKWEGPTLKVIAVAFFALAAFVTVDSFMALWSGEAPENSTVGIVIAAASVVLMPAISVVERRTGEELGSATAIADSKQLLVCAYLSAAVLIGLVLHAAFGWWQADPIAALVVAGLAIHEGKEAWEGDGCATSSARALAGDTESACCSDSCCG